MGRKKLSEKQKKTRKDVLHDSYIKNKEHIQKYHEKYYEKNKYKISQQGKKYYKNNKARILSRNKEYWKKQKQLVLDQYGSICSCCGEHRVEFLTIDHINGGGHQHRESLKKKGKNFLFWLINNNFPEGYQVLCMNCNFSKGLFGYCPHEREREV